MIIMVPFIVTDGLVMGTPLSPTLSKFYMADVIMTYISKSPKENAKTKLKYFWKNLFYTSELNNIIPFIYKKNL